MRIVFDENTPRAVARAVGILAAADAIGSPELIEVMHALDVVSPGTSDVLLIQAVADGSHAAAAIVTSDKSMRTRQHERAAFTETGCIGIVLQKQWNHASMWDRARVTLRWWPSWVEQVRTARPGTLWQCPWSEKPKPLKSY